MIFTQCIADPHGVVCSLMFVSLAALAVAFGLLVSATVLLLRMPR